ncbi:hypothetical protein HDU76_007196, partial [Blyttiomyces sp. JEL0837]
MTTTSGSIFHINSYWCMLAPEIQTIILDNCDLLTRYLNNCLTDEEIKTHSVAIWNLAIKFNFQGDLSTLPKEVPNVKNGLANITSRDFYKQLCMFQPDLAGTNILVRFMHSMYLTWALTWKIRSTFFHSFVRAISGSTSGSFLPKMLLHIPMRHQWMDDEDLANIMEQHDDNLEMI